VGCPSLQRRRAIRSPDVAELEGLFAALERWQAAYRPVCFPVGSRVVIFFPPLFGCR
jgi:hypothetical protein